MLNAVRTLSTSILAMGGVLFCGLFILGYSIDQKILESYKDKIHAELRSDIELIANNITTKISVAVSLTDAISIFSEENIDLDAQSGRQILSKYMDALSAISANIRAIIVLNKDGIIVEDLRPQKPALGIDVSDRDYFKVHLNQSSQDTHISTPVTSRVDNKQTWTISRAARDSSGQLLAVIVASFDGQYLAEAAGGDLISQKTDGVVLSLDSGTILSAAGSFEGKVGQEINFSDYTSVSDVIILKHINPWPLFILATPSDSYVEMESLHERKNIRLGIIALGILVILSIMVIWVSGKKLVLANRNIEKMLRETSILHQQSTSASIAKSEFLANMSHELRTPLNAIIGFSEIIKDHVFGPLGNRKYDEYAENIHGAGEHLLQLINNVLDVSAIESGKLELFEEPKDIKEIYVQAANLIRDKAEDKNITIHNPAGGLLPLVMCDELRVKQVLLNLLTNAIKFTPDGGSVSMRTHLDDDGALLVSVTDTGIGMDERGIQKAVAHFDQVDKSHSRSHQGIGLGLPLSKDLMDLHGGGLDIESAPGEGTTVTLRFPKSRLMAT